MPEMDPYANFSDDQLLEEVERMEAEEEQAAAELGADLAPVDASLDVDISSPAEQLEAWNEFVTDFGGRLSSPAKKTLLGELSDGQLGQTIFLPTSDAAPVFETVLLAEVNLSRPVAMDVTFNYTNMKNIGPPALAPPLDQGNGFVRLTWGAQGTFKRVAQIDGNRGWRRQFSASFMRVEYVPVDPTQSNILPGGQARDLGVAAMISPAIGSVSETLTKTVFFQDVLAGQVRSRVIPRWAKNFQMAGDWEFFNGDWDVFLTDAQSFTVQRVGSDSAEAWTLAAATKWPVPQRAQTIFLIPLIDIDNPTAIFELAL